MAGFSILAKLGLDSSKFKKGIKTSDTALSKFGKAIGNVVTAGAAIATTAFAAFTVKGVKDIVEFEKKMSEVFTLLPGITKESMDAMTADTRKLATAMGVDLMDATNALYQAISAGVPKENVIEFMTVASKAAIGGVTSLETAVDGITSVINTYGRENITAKEAADSMFTAVKLGKTTFEELSGSLFNVLPIAKQANVKFDEISAALAVMTAKGTPTSVATTQLRQAITALIAPTSKTVKHFDSYGLSVGNLKALMAGGDGGLVKAMENVMIATNGDETAIRKLVGSTEAMNAILTLTSGNAKSFGDAMVEMATKAGANDAAFKTMAQTVAHQLNVMLGNLKDLGMQFGAAFLPLINQFLPKAITLFKDLGPKLKDFAKDFPGLVKDIAATVATLGKFAAAIVAYSAAAKVAKVAMGAWSIAVALFTTRTTAATVATGKLNAAAKANVFGLVAAGAIAAGVAVKGFIDEVGEVKGLEFAKKWLKDINGEISANKVEAAGAAERIKALYARLEEFNEADFANKQLNKGISLLETQLDLRRKDLELAKTGQGALKETIADLDRKIAKEKERHKLAMERAKSDGDRRLEELRHERDLGKLQGDRDRMEEEYLTKKVAEKELTKEIADLEAQAANEAKTHLATTETGLEIVTKVREQHEASKTAVGQLGIMEAGLSMLQSKKLTLLGAEGTKRRLNKEEADALLVIEKDILVAEGDIQNFIAGQLKLARDKEKKQVEDLNAELQKTIDREKAIAKEIGLMAAAREADVVQLRADLKAANADLEPFRKFFSIDKFTGKVKSNMGLIGDEFRRIRAEEEATRIAILPENVRTLKQYEEMLRANAGEALKHRNNIIEMGRHKKAEAHQLRIEELDHLMEADGLATEQFNLKNELLAKQEAAQEGEQKTLAELGVQTAALSTLLEQMKEGKIDIGSGKLQDALKALQADFALIPPTSKDIVGAVDKVNGTMAAVDGKMATLAGKDFAPTVNVTVDGGEGGGGGGGGGGGTETHHHDITVNVEGAGGGGGDADLVLPAIPVTPEPVTPVTPPPPPPPPPPPVLPATNTGGVETHHHDITVNVEGATGDAGEEIKLPEIGTGEKGEELATEVTLEAVHDTLKGYFVNQ